MGEQSAGKTRSRVFIVLANVVSLICLVWSLRHVRLGQLRDDIATMNWWWVAVAVVGVVSVYYCQAWRWNLVVHPVEPVTFNQTLRSILIGLFANEVLPFRAGEILRCYLLSRWTQLPFSVSLSSALIERIFDGIWLYIGLMISFKLVPHPHHLHYLISAGYALGAIVLGGALLLGVAMFHPHRARAVLSGNSWQRHLRVLIDDLSLIGHSRFLYYAFVVSLPHLLLTAIPIYAAFKGYGFDDLGWREAFVLCVILRMGAAVPLAPGNIGLFQLLTKESLVKIFNVVPVEAERFSLVLWGIGTIPLLVAGAIALAVTGAKIGELTRAARVEHKELEKSRST